MSKYKDISYEVIGPVCRILHNRPRQRNAQSVSLLNEIDEAMRVAEEDEEVRVIIIGAVGDHFSAGHDIKEAAGRPDVVEARYFFEERHYLGYCMRIWDSPKPVIAQVQGACIAAGFMVANMCDLIVASDDAYFSDPTTANMASAATEVLIHPWVMGIRAAKEFLYTGRKLFATEALAIGMINRVVLRDELEAATMELANEIARAAPFGLKMTKRSLNRTADMQGFRNAIQAHFDTHELCHTTQEYRDLRAGGLAKVIESNKRLSAS